jgi:hypothetical protein
VARLLLLDPFAFLPDHLHLSTFDLFLNLVVVRLNEVPLLFYLFQLPSVVVQLILIFLLGNYELFLNLFDILLP